MNKKLLLVALFICAIIFYGFKPAEDQQAELVLDAKALLGEGSIWHPQENKLYWVDIQGKSLHIYDPATNEDKEFPLGSRVGTVVPAKGGGALVALQNACVKLIPKPEG